MTEFNAALTVLWCCITYWLGGQEIPFFDRGFKWIRRFVMPTGLAVSLIFLGGAVWWKALIACSLLSAATHIGYQNKLWKFSLTGLLFGAPAIILCWPTINWMIGFPFTYHTAYGFISLKNNRFRWAFVGLLEGLGIGLAFVTSAPLR